MPDVYRRIRRCARQIADLLPEPDFYIAHAAAYRESRLFFASDDTLARLKRIASEHIENDFGHGMDHALKVTLDAGTLMIIEGGNAGYSEAFARKRLQMVQSAGLLHDIKRKHKNHAVEGARFAQKILKGFSFTDGESEEICQAIRNHEAFKTQHPIPTPETGLLSGCLYDADKFRWGPDNFRYTIWDMLSFSEMPLAQFVARYPKGMESLVRIRHSFRTPTGKAYGPQFIDQGIAIGEQLIQVIQNEFFEYL